MIMISSTTANDQHFPFSIWQRVPVTEKSGRVHTSAVSVAILPQADEVITFSVEIVLHII
jgi:hypothetical protein